MLISVVTITLNNLSGLKKTVDSVVKQKNFDSIEYIIVDGGSRDGTREYLEKLPQKIRWISEKDRGISHAFNKGLSLSKGDIILMLNAGDSLISSCALCRIEDDWKNNNVNILSYEIEKKAKKRKTDRVKQYDLKWCEIPHQSTFVARKVYEIVGNYSEEYKIRMDYHFFARCKEAGMTFSYIPFTLVEYEGNGISTLKKYRYRNWKEALSVKLLYGIPISYKDVIKISIIKLLDAWKKV